MTHAQRKQQRKAIHSWKNARPLLERWRKDLKMLTIELKQPRVIDTVPIDFVSGSRSKARESRQRHSGDNSFTSRAQT
jgi:hypothetical protein